MSVRKILFGIAAALVLSAGFARSQPRDFAAHDLILDDNNHHFYTIQTTALTANQTLNLPDFAGGSTWTVVPEPNPTTGNADQVLRWDVPTATWVVTGSVTIDDPTAIVSVHCFTAGQSGGGLTDDTHFVECFDAAGNDRGGIHGQSISELESDPVYVANDQANTANLTLGIVQAGLAVGAAAAAADPFSAPAGAVLVAQIAAALIQLGFAENAYYKTIHALQNNCGIVLISSAGDYAEYLKRENPLDKFSPGDIVGVRNGLISKNTEHAQSVCSISMAPIVLGNVPPKGEEKLFNKVGFLGQVPVKVRGAVHQGDFIIASGLNDGIGVAVSPDSISLAQMESVIGRAWSDVPQVLASRVNYVKVAVGMNAKAMTEVMSREQKEIDALKNQIANLKSSDEELAALKARLDRMEQGSPQVKHASLKRHHLN